MCKMSKIPVSIQLYTLREACEQDFAGTLKRVAELGFDGVEFAGFGGLTAQDVKRLLDKYQLQASSSHVPLDQLQNNLDQVIEEQKILGSKYIVIPYLGDDQRDEASYRSLISFIEEAGEKCRKEGLTLCYHNHDFELERLSDGRTALETILEDTSAENVKAEFDVYWLQKADHNPVEWIHRFKDRTPLLHLKDMTLDDEKFFAELGTGGVDIDAVIEAGKEIGVDWFVVEQDATRKTPFESIEISMDYLKDRFPHLANK